MSVESVFFSYRKQICFIVMADVLGRIVSYLSQSPIPFPDHHIQLYNNAYGCIFQLFF